MAGVSIAFLCVLFKSQTGTISDTYFLRFFCFFSAHVFEREKERVNHDIFMIAAIYNINVMDLFMIAAIYTVT